MPSPVRAPDWRRSVGRPPPRARAASSQQPCRTLAVLPAGGAQPALLSRTPAAPERDRAEVRLRVPRHRSLPSSGPDDGISRPRTTKSSHWSPAPRSAEIPAQPRTRILPVRTNFRATNLRRRYLGRLRAPCFGYCLGKTVCPGSARNIKLFSASARGPVLGAVSQRSGARSEFSSSLGTDPFRQHNGRPGVRGRTSHRS